MTNAGSVRIEQGDGTTLDVTLVNARPAEVSAERAQFRPPFGSTWFVDGDDLRGVELLTLSLEVVDDALVDAAPAVQGTLAALRSAALLEVPWGTLVPRGVLTWTVAPIELGYRLDVTLATDGWAADEAGILRLIDGRVWELR